ncbi:30S ribosomal protein S6 [bacterium]|nr:30S ribosomal protein S6 [bacterium]
MNKYEGLFILEPPAREEVLKQTLDHLQDLIKQAGGKVEKVQKLDQRSFARNTGKQTSGYYVNYVFEAPAKATAELDAKLRLVDGVFRWQFTVVEPVREYKPRRRRTETAETGPAAPERVPSRRRG